MRARAGVCGTAVALALAGSSLFVQTPKLAHACGGFFSTRTVALEHRPSLAYEQTLIIYDSEKKHEHFVREVVFRASKEPFGFVVPTPARPEVAKVTKSPFETLLSEFPFEDYGGLGLVGTIGGGRGTGLGGGGVQVLEVKRVGSFTAFVLAADDPKALADWLKKNALVSTPEADAWLTHYVDLHFFYVAMRYDPPAGDAASARTKAETVRISFDSPLAYYPYLEPSLPPGRKPDEPRMLEIWLLEKSRTVPVAARIEGESTRWVRPFDEGQFFKAAAKISLDRALGSDLQKLLPTGDLMLQRFIDQKRSRQGFGDVLFVPAEKTTPSADELAKLRALAPILDPSLVRRSTHE